MTVSEILYRETCPVRTTENNILTERPTEGLVTSDNCVSFASIVMVLPLLACYVCSPPFHFMGEGGGALTSSRHEGAEFFEQVVDASHLNMPLVLFTEGYCDESYNRVRRNKRHVTIHPCYLIISPTELKHPIAYPLLTHGMVYSPLKQGGRDLKLYPAHGEGTR